MQAENETRWGAVPTCMADHLHKHELDLLTPGQRSSPADFLGGPVVALIIWFQILPSGSALKCFAGKPKLNFSGCSHTLHNAASSVHKEEKRKNGGRKKSLLHHQSLTSRHESPINRSLLSIRSRRRALGRRRSLNPRLWSPLSPGSIYDQHRDTVCQPQGNWPFYSLKRRKWNSKFPGQSNLESPERHTAQAAKAFRICWISPPIANATAQLPASSNVQAHATIAALHCTDRPTATGSFRFRLSHLSAKAGTFREEIVSRLFVLLHLLNKFFHLGVNCLIQLMSSWKKATSFSTSGGEWEDVSSKSMTRCIVWGTNATPGKSTFLLGKVPAFLSPLLMLRSRITVLSFQWKAAT